MNPHWSVEFFRSDHLQPRLQKRHDQACYFGQVFVASAIFLRWSHSNSARSLNRRMHQPYETISLFCSVRSFTATAVFLCCLHRNSARLLNESISLFCSVRSLTATAVFLCCLHRNSARPLNESISLFCSAVLQQSLFFCAICIQIRHAS